MLKAETMLGHVKKLDRFTNQMQKLISKNKVGGTIATELIADVNAIKPAVC